MAARRAITPVVVCYCLAVVISSVIATNSYLFIAPNTIRPGNDLTIQGKLLADTSTPVTVTAYLEKSTEKESGFWPSPEESTTTTAAPPEPISMVQSTISGTEPQTLVLKIPNTLPDDRYQLRIKGTGGLQFSNTTQLSYHGKSQSIFVQTDKAIYKPGQTIHFRIFGMTSDLKVTFEPMFVELYDPAGNKINQWSVMEVDLRAAGGVFESLMVMSDAPILGDWKIKVKQVREQTEKSFTVDEYVLPKFEVTLVLPPFGRLTDKEFQGKVTAQYTYGKPVKGVAEVRIRPRWHRFDRRVLRSRDIEIQLPIDGEASFRVPVSQLEEAHRWLDRSYLIFEANVTETLTGSKLRAPDVELQFFKQITKLEFPSSLPNNFKPGLPYTSVVKVAEQDGSTPSMIKGPLSVKVTFYRPERTTTTTTTTPATTMSPENVTGEITIPVIEPMIIRHRWGEWGHREDEELLPEMNFTIPADGIVEIPLTIPSDVTRVSLRANYDSADTYSNIKKSHSPSDSYMQLSLLSDSPKSGGSVQIGIRSTNLAQKDAFYQVMSKGSIVAMGTVSLTNDSWVLPITAEMAPKAKLMVFYVRPDGEVVADGLTFNVDGIFENQVTIAFDQQQVAPGASIQLTVTADPGSKVNVLAVDKSVLLLKSGNDISHDQVRSELQSYDTSDRNRDCGWFCWRWPTPASGADAKDVFDNAGLVYITDALIYDHVEPNRRIDLRSMSMARGGFQMDRLRLADSEPQMMSTSISGPPKMAELAEPKRVRKLFPETWLWETSKTAANGSVTFESMVPDTITSWVATAFAVNQETGLGLSKSAANLQTFLPFFVSLHLPYSVVRGEKVIVQANVFNYNTVPVFAYVLLRKNPHYDNIHISSWWTGQYSADVARFVMIQPNSASAVYFPIIPRELGQITLKVEARSVYSADAIEKLLLVEPEGTADEYNFPVLLDLQQTPNFFHKVPITFPPNTVPGSQRIRVTAIGDLMGPSINGLDSLIKMPYGCGEQNMLNFAPNIFVTKYLGATNNIDQALMEKTKNYMTKGYQRELTYQHKDGSFSAFGDNDPSGSMWLSAFVLKSFVQARPYIFVDDDVIKRTVAWILTHQAKNGTFEEPGRVLHKEMQGGSIAGERSLTAFVLAALLEARKVEGVDNLIAGNVTLSIAYLEEEVPFMSDPFELAITGYVLTLAGSAQAKIAMDKLKALATNEGGMKYWKKAESPAGPATNPWDKPNGKALNVELTSYALMALAAMGNRTEGLSVLKWLTNQRNPSGGFSSTQDTIVALQALADMAYLVYSKNFDVSVTVTYPPSGQELFTINAANALVLQSRELPGNVPEVNIAANGTGLSLVEVAVFYHINKDDASPSFNLKITLPEESINHYIAEVCTSYMKEGASGMSVIEIGYPSGFSADPKSVSPHRLLKRVEEGDTKVILYLDEIGKDEVASALRWRVGLVAGAQPVPVKVYDYYEPADHVTAFYVPEVLRNSDVCDVCGQECDFCVKQQFNIGAGRV